MNTYITDERKYVELKVINQILLKLQLYRSIYCNNVMLQEN